MKPTAAQVHVALSFLDLASRCYIGKIMPQGINDIFYKATNTIRIAFELEGWDGSTETCPPFGFESKKKELEEKKDASSKGATSQS